MALVSGLALWGSRDGSASGIVDTASIPVGIEGMEFPVIKATSNNVSTSGISLPAGSWTWNDVSLNFSGIVLGKETKTVVDASTTRREMSKTTPPIGYAVEVLLSEPTVLYGAFIPITFSNPAPPTVNLELRGCDAANNRPNATVYKGVMLNMTLTNSSWRFHSFDAIQMQPGRYFLSVDASAISSPTKLYWNCSLSTTSGLYTSNYTTSWQNGSNSIGPMSYKLVQKSTKVYKPTDLDMKVDINGTNYPVADLPAVGTGNVSKDGLNLPNPGTSLTFPVHTNRSATAYFNVTCLVGLSRPMGSSGFVTATSGHPNAWSFILNLNRVGSDYHAELDLGSSWYFTRMYRNDVDISNETQRMGNVLVITNSSINAGSSWLFTASSPAIDFSASFPKTTFNPGDTISVSATPPALTGQFTFVIYNSLGGEEFKETRANGPGIESVSRTLSQSAPEGTGSVLIAWNNQTDAGIFAASYTVSIPPPTDIITIVVIVAAVVSGAFIVSLALYTVVRRTRRRLEAERLDVINKAKDLFNLNYLIILDKKSGIDIFGQSFGEFMLDPTLVSGFLSAIGSFGLELTNTDEDSQTIKLEYKKSKIVISEFKGFRITLIMKDAPSSSMVAALDSLAHDIDEKYGKALKAFNGETTEFQDMGTIIEKHLHVSFIAPLKVSPREKVELTQDEKDVYNRATDISMAKKMNPFFASELFTGDEIDPKAVSAFFALMGKGIITPAK